MGVEGGLGKSVGAIDFSTVRIRVSKRDLASEEESNRLP